MLSSRLRTITLSLFMSISPGMSISSSTLNFESSTALANKAQSQAEIDTIWMEKCIELANLAWQSNEVPVGAIIVDAEQNVIGWGYNQLITNHDPSAHAEITAIRTAGQSLLNYRLLDATVYVTLEPCIMCAGAMVHARLKRVVFGAFDQKTGAAGSYMDYFQQAGLNHYCEVSSGVLAEKTSSLLSDFFAMRRAQIKSEKRRKHRG
jgi:tRNA(adenine34) deaminase